MVVDWQTLRICHPQKMLVLGLNTNHCGWIFDTLLTELDSSSPLFP